MWNDICSKQTQTQLVNRVFPVCRIVLFYNQRLHAYNQSRVIASYNGSIQKRVLDTCLLLVCIARFKYSQKNGAVVDHMYAYCICNVLF